MDENHWQHNRPLQAFHEATMADKIRKEHIEVGNPFTTLCLKGTRKTIDSIIGKVLAMI
jgi:hypothetical protein